MMETHQTLQRHIDIDEMHIYNRKLRARGQFGKISLHQTFYWSYLILCLHNIDTLNICMKKFYAKILFFDKMTALWT